MENKYTIKNPMAPLWIMYPWISQGSIGWRWGSSEGYKWDLYDWLETLTKNEQLQYEKMFPEPRTWRGYYNKDENINCDEYLWKVDGCPEYSFDDLVNDYKEDKELEYLFFWGHQPSKDGTITKSCFSQWWKEDFAVDIEEYCCMEQYMMAEKARLFGDNDIEDKIMQSKEPKEIKSLGRKVKNFDEKLWDKCKYSIVLNGNCAKFMQNKPLMDYLISTEDKILVEASPYDDIWGIKMSVDNNEIKNPLAWKGKNLLGFALMEVRNELMRVCKNYDKINWDELKLNKNY